RVTAELRLGLGRQVNHKRVERLMRERGLQGVTRRRRAKGCTRSRPDDPRSDDLVHRQFRPDGPDRLWVQDITQHRTGEGWVYLAVVIDAWSRRVVGWSIADHLRAEHVQHHEIRPHDCNTSESIRPVTGKLDVVALEPQSSTERIAQRLIVIDHDYPGGHGGAPLIRRPTRCCQRRGWLGRGG
ncbi:MAG: IS3 family transposase, partial [Actinomycetota bacterium]|nr:IS3 family transposase [Actinomycetota bacterium]